jgi:biopolymer transport protein ExbD
MSARRVHKKWSAHTGPNMTPMVDVVMCILIFFMLSATFAMPELYLTSNTPAVEKVGLSNSAATEQIPAVRNYIQLKRLGDQTVATAFGQPGTADLVSQTAGLPGLLKAKGQQLSKDVQIIIAPENHVPYKDVIAVYDACIAAHFEHVAFAPVSTR